MKLQLLTALCLFLIFSTHSCTKDKNDIRDQFLGAYDYTFALVGEDGQGEYSEQGSGTLIIRKGAAANELNFDDGSVDFTAELSGQVFAIPLFIVNQGGDDYQLQGSGSFQANTVQYSLRAEAIGFFDQSTISVNGTKR